MNKQDFAAAISRRADSMLRESRGAWRKGQCLFNALYWFDAELADIIRATPADPFYRDERIPAFWKELLGEL